MFLFNFRWDFSTLIDHVPLIGDIILDEYKKEHHNEKEIHVSSIIRLILINYS